LGWSLVVIYWICIVFNTSVLLFFSLRSAYNQLRKKCIISKELKASKLRCLEIKEKHGKAGKGRKREEDMDFDELNLHLRQDEESESVSVEP